MDRRITERIKDMFAIPRGQTQAWAFLVALLLAACVWIVYEQHFATNDPGKYAEEEHALQAWLAERAFADSTERSSTGETLRGTGYSRLSEAEVFAFDPNHLPIDQWQRLGLSEKQAQAIHRYEERGGEFRSKADLARMRVIRPELIESWWPFIQLPDSNPSKNDFRRSEGYASNDRQRDTTRRHWSDAGEGRDERATSTRARKLEVNTCDSVQLEALPGIGSSFARGIIKYRDQLGGYFTLDQLAEVYVLQDKPEAVARLKELLVVDTLMVMKLPINSCTVEQLAAHPYLRWKLAKPLFAYRQQHGPFTSIVAIKGCAVITEEVYRKVAPYVTLE